MHHKDNMRGDLSIDGIRNERFKKKADKHDCWIQIRIGMANAKETVQTSISFGIVILW